MQERLTHILDLLTFEPTAKVDRHHIGHRLVGTGDHFLPATLRKKSMKIEIFANCQGLKLHK